MSRVKCRITGEYGTPDTFVKIGNAYYKSQEIYDAAEREKEYRKKATEIILNDFLHYEAGRPYPAVLNKKYNELSKFYSNEVIYKTIASLRKDLSWRMSRMEFKNEYSALAYVFAAIKNHIGDIYTKEKKAKQVKEVPKEDSQMINEIFNDSLVVKNQPTYTQTRDISNFLQ